MSRRRAPTLNRRRWLARVGLATGAWATGCTPRAGRARVTEERPVTQTETTTTTRMPVVYLPHGGGPWPFVDIGFGDPAEWARLADYLRGLGRFRPRAMLVVSAHWEAPIPTVGTGERPPLLFDYYGFPAEAYRLTWPAPGDPALARRVRALLSDAGLASAEDATRGFDHGTFVPLKLSHPAADVPTVQLSLVAGLDPAAHLALGRALRPLRDEGVLIVGSGMSYHDMRGFGSARGRDDSIAFDAWLRETVALPAPARDARLARWQDAPAGRRCHPREEHLLPLMVIAGAAGEDAGVVPYADSVLGVRIAAAHFGDVTATPAA